MCDWNNKQKVGINHYLLPQLIIARSTLHYIWNRWNKVIIPDFCYINYTTFWLEHATPGLKSSTVWNLSFFWPIITLIHSIVQSPGGHTSVYSPTCLVYLSVHWVQILSKRLQRYSLLTSLSQFFLSWFKITSILLWFIIDKKPIICIISYCISYYYLFLIHIIKFLTSICNITAPLDINCCWTLQLKV